MAAGISYASQGIGGLNYVDSHVLGSVANTVAETTIAHVSITADAVRTRIIVFASIRMKNISGANNGIHFKLKTGTLGAEVERDDQYLECPNGMYTGGSMLYMESTLTWTAAQSVIITATCDAAHADLIGYCHQLVVIGQ